MLNPSHRFSVLALSATLLLSPFLAAPAFAATLHATVNDDPVTGGGDPIPTPPPPGMISGGTIAIIVVALSVANLA